jgi:hypothetical protein
MTILRIQVNKPVRGSQFARARGQPTAAKACRPASSSCGPSYRSKYSKAQCKPCAPCDPCDPFGIMPMLNNMARMSTMDCSPRTTGTTSYAGYTIPKNIAVDIIEVRPAAPAARATYQQCIE